MATKPPSLHDFFIGRPAPTQTDVAYSNILDSGDAARARQANHIGRDIGLPGATVTADLDGFGQEQQNNKTLNIIGADPHIANFLVDPHRAASVKDDLPALSDISALFRMGEDPTATKGGWANYMRQTRAGRTPLLNAITLNNNQPQEYSFKRAATPNPPQFFTNKVPQAPYYKMPNLGEWMSGQAAGTFANIESSMAGTGMFLADTIGQGEALKQSGAYRSLISQMQEDQAESQRIYDMIPTYIGQQAYAASQSIALMGAAILTKKPVTTLAVQQGAQQYEQVRTRGGTANEAALSGAVSGAAEGAFEKYFGLGWMLGNFGKKATGKFIGGLLLREVPSEVATTAVQDLADAMTTGGGGWEAYKDRLPADLLNTAASTAIMVGMMGGAHYVGRRLAPQARAVDDIERAAAGSQFVDDLMVAAEKSKTKAEDPQTLKDFIDHRTQDSPVRNLYVPVEAAVSYMQSEKYGGELDRYQNQIAQAQQTQGDVVIPIGDAVANLSGTPAWDALREDVRIEPGGLSRKEATAQHAEIIDQLEKRGKEIAAQVDEKQGATDAAGEVYTEVKNRLRLLGVDDRQADAVAQIYAARYEARAARLGGTPMEQFKRSKITFPGEAVGQFEGGREIGKAEPQSGKFDLSTIDARMAATGEEIGRQRDRNLGDDPLTHAMELAVGLSVLGTSGRSAEDQTPDALKAIEEAKAWGRADIIELIRDRAERQGAAPAGEPGVEKNHPRYGAIKAKMEEGKKAVRTLADQVIAAADKALQELKGEQSREVAQSRMEQAQVDAPPLEGMPQNIKVGGERIQFGPHATAREAAQAYMKKAGLPYNPPRTYVRVDPARGARIAQAFEDMNHNPNDPAVKAAYGALKKETVAQWRAIEKTGLKVEFIKGADPYGNPRDAILDVVRNNHLWVYPTDAGFGSSDKDVSDNPLLDYVPGVEIDGQKVRYNDLFRIVHDYFGHIKEGVGFRADGEENAWRIHSAMFSPLARQALTTETRGQNSWVNFGPHGVANQTASSEDTVYADQKIGLLPDWVVNEGAGDERTLNQDAALLGWPGVAEHLTDEEKANVREATKRKILSLVETLPDAKEYAAAAAAGRAKRGWYEQSAQAILDVFGAADAPRFAALLAALSPQTSVESNLFNALRTWTFWNDAGRPQSRREIVGIMGQAVQGKKGAGSVLNAWINNSFAALTAEDLTKLELSGAKVNSFYSNLVGAVDEVTNDTWMAMFSGLDMMSAGWRPTKTPLYKAMNAVVRRAADILTKKTGQTWTPAEVQETVWSFAKTLYEMRDRAGETDTMRQLLAAGKLTHADIANTPDFAVLFANGVFRTILEQGGYGEQIAAIEGRGRPAQVAGEGRITDAAETGFSQRDLQRFLNRAADRLEEVRARRQANSRTLRQDVLPEAGWTPERVSGLIDQFGNEDGSSSAIAVMMSPDEYLAMNASAAGREMIAKRVAEMEQYGGKLDVQRLQDSPPIYLGVALGGPNDTRPPPMVRGHDGRHRMALLKAAGVARVPVIVSLTDKDGKAIRVTEPMKVSNVIPNRSRSDQMSTGDRVGEISGVPISFRYQDQLESMGQRVLFQALSPSGLFRETKRLPDGTILLEYQPSVTKAPIPIKMAIDNGVAEVAIDQFSTAANRLGVAKVREAMNDLLVMYPEIKTFGGYRRSGAGKGRVQEIVLHQGERGSTTFTDDGAKLIQLFSSADRSTLLHETGHIWLEELKQDAETDEASAKDWEIVKKWFATNGFEISKSNFIPTGAHEIWARGVERYFMEGKSPSIGLAGVFRTFKSWLLRIYGVVQNLNTPITPEVREVMDRLIATQDAIDDARAMNATDPLFKTAQEAGMTDAEFADYQQRISDARDEAYDALLFKTMESIRRRKSGEMRDARAAIRAEVGEVINKQPQFRLLHLLRTGKWLGEPDRPAVDLKLNTGWLIDNFGEGILDQLPRGIQIWSGKGETGDVVAEMVGMGSGTEVVQTLVGMRAASDELRNMGETRSMRDKLVSEETDRVMAERHGDPLNDGTIEEEAIAAINSARQGEIIASEVRQLSKRHSALGAPTPYQFAREWAKRTVAEGHVRDVASRAALQRYIRASNKAARAAEEAILKGDTDEAFRQKQAQLLNHALLAEAKAAADRIDRIITKLKKLAGRAAQKSIDPAYFEKIQTLLENYDFKPRSERSIDEQAQFQKWLEDQRAKGFEVHIPPRLENNGTPYTRVTVQELESLGDLVDSLVTLGRLKQKIKVAQDERDFSEYRDEVVARIKQLPTRKLPDKPINEETRKIASMAAELLKVETIAEELDGGKTGPLHDVLVLGATTAENKRHTIREKVLIPLAKMYHALGRKYWRHLQERVTIPELRWNTLNEGDPRLGSPVTVTRSELLAIFMNMGNLSNLEKLSRGERWNVDALKQVMDRELTKEDYDFAQQIWDTVDKLWPEIVEAEREMSGVVPERVVNNPIETPHGTYRGGYWPIVYDPARWQLAEDLEGKEVDDMFGLKSGVATQKGHTITRTGAFGPINLSLERVLFHHIEQVATRIAYAPYARDVLRTIRDKSIRGWIDTKLGPEYRKQIEPWLGRQIHNGYAFPKGARWWDHLMRQFRINTTIAAMGFRVSTGVAQTLGLGASIQRIGARWVGTGLMRLAQHPREAARFAYAKSPELYHRTEAVNREVMEVSNRMRQRHKWWTDAQHWAMFHIGMIDRYMVSLPTWLGAYEKARTTMDMTDEAAVAFADKAVRMSQGTGREKDMAAVQSPNSEAMRFFTMFYTPFNVMFNAQWQGARALKRGQIEPMLSATFWWVIAQTLGGALLGGDWPEWEDPKDIEKWFARNVFFGLFAGIPIARDAASYANRKLAGKYASDIGTTPITRVAVAVEQAWNQGKRKVETGENPKRPIKEGGDLAAILLGVPTSQIGTTTQFAWDVHEGEQSPKNVSDWYFGLTSGKVPEPKE